MASSQGKMAIQSVYLIMFMDMFAVSLFVPHIKFYMKGIGASDLTIGTITSLYGFVQLVSTPITGSFADAFNRKIVLLVCLVLTAISYISMSITTNVLLFTIIRLMTGCFKHTQVLGKTMLSELATKNGIHLSSLLGKSEAFGTMGFAIGPLAAGLFIQDEKDFPLLCLAAAAIFFVNIYLTIVLIPELGSRDSDVPPLAKDDNDNQIETPKDTDRVEFTPEKQESGEYKKILPVIILNFLFCLTIHIVRESTPFMLRDKYNTTSLQLGFMYSLQNSASTVTGFTIGSLVVGLYNQQSKMMVVHGGLLQLGSVLLLLNTSTFTLACIAMVLQSIANQFLAVGLKCLALAGTKREGATLGFIQTASSSSRVLAPVLVGFFGSHHDEVTLMAAVTALLGLFGTIQYIDEFSIAKLKDKAKFHVS